MKSPAAPAKPETVTFGRVSYVDPYTWLEDENPEALEFSARQDQLTRDWFAASPASAQAAALLDSMPRIESDFPIYCGGRWFRKRTPEGRAMHVLEVADAATGPWRVFLDLEAWSKGRMLNVDHFVPSPDGRKAVIGFGVDGRELAELRVFDVDTSAVLMGQIPQAYPFFSSCLPHITSFYITARNAADMAAGSRVYRHLLGQEMTTQPEDHKRTADEMWVRPSANGRHSILIADHLNPRPDCLRDETTDEGWQPFLQGEKAQFRGDIAGDHFYAVTNEGAPRGRVVSIPLATPTDRSSWKELIPGSADVLATLLVVDGLLVLVDLVDTWSRMRVFDLDGRLKGEVPMPGRGSISVQQFALFNMLDMFNAGPKGTVLFPFSSPARSAALYQADVHALTVKALTPHLVDIPAQFQTHKALSADGARVPYHVIARADVDLSQPQPTAM